MPGKCLLRYSKRKKRLSRHSKQEVQKRKNLTFFQRGLAMVLVQKWPLLQLFFLGNVGQKNVFYDILERKNAFLDYKNKKFKKIEKIDIFPKGLTDGFGQKMTTFPTLILKKL